MRADAHRSQCEVYLKMQLSIFVGEITHSSAKFTSRSFGCLLIGHVKHVGLLSTSQAPDAYVETYIRPDPQNLTERKTQVVKASQNPTYTRVGLLLSSMYFASGPVGNVH
ncbi:hypothetical protein ANCCAN_14830 [Ancylostoma caninum]|uniref:C2 domain-containing protein n=1 Tax=Ancylostoma caninum TaxID=29170 RepID=A0A368G479_ANCCA|nr:hypothetical protein ANCCAN_14830 [Ancylostoma caninum]